MKMLNEFKTFLIRSNALALAIGVIFGAAAGKIVSNIVDDLLMPVISLVLPGSTWDTAMIHLGTNPDPKDPTKTVEFGIKYGHFLGGVIEFIIVAFVLYLLAKYFVKEAMPAAPAAAAPTKECPFCKETVPASATKCKFCTSNI